MTAPGKEDFAVNQFCDLRQVGFIICPARWDRRGRKEQGNGEREGNV